MTFGAVTGATSLPDATLGAPLTGGRNKGAALLLVGDTSDEPLLELSPIGPGGVRAVAIERAISTLDISRRLPFPQFESLDAMFESWEK